MNKLIKTAFFTFVPCSLWGLSRKGVFGERVVNIPYNAEYINDSNLFYDKYKINWCSIVSKGERSINYKTYMQMSKEYYSLRPIIFKFEI